MIRLTLVFTDNLGPEADLGPLLKKFDDYLHAAPIGDAHVLVDARVLLDYVAETGDVAWASVILTLSAPASLEGALTPCQAALLEMTEAHLCDLLLRRSIVISSRLVLHPDATEIQRRHLRPPGAAF